MRVLFNAAFDTQANVGISLYIRRLAPELSKLCDLTILTPDPQLFSGAARTIRIPDWTRSHIGRVAWTTSFLPRYCTRDFDAVFCPTPVVPMNPPLPTIAVVHDLTPLMLPRLHSARLKTLFWLALQSLRWADAIITDSACTRSDLIAYAMPLPPERITVVHAGPCIAPNDQESSFAARLTPYILYVGGHALHKNLPRLLAAFAQLRCPSSLRLIITGWSKPELIARTRSAIERHGLQQRVIIISDRLRETELSSLYADCTAFVYPSLYEGFGLPVLEALAHGAAVACSNTSSIPEIAGDAALYFNPWSTADLTEKMEMLLSQPDLAQKLRGSGPKRARQFSWSTTAEKILSTLQRVSLRCPAPQLGSDCRPGCPSPDA
jgi:glycosyltransferase involved in cell wall biosynthesis